MVSAEREKFFKNEDSIDPRKWPFKSSINVFLKDK